MSDPGREMYELMERLYPICRSLTGDGVRETLDLIEEQIPLERTEVPSGTQVYDWTLPREWNIREAWLAGPDGERIVDFADSNLHVLGYSVPVRKRLPLSELREHLFSDPERPDVTPYRTSYHNENWGFCLPHRQLEALEDGEYEAVIDSTLEDGVVTYAECLLPGETRGRDPALDLHLPPLALQRQPLGDRAADGARQASAGGAAALLVPLPVQPGDDRAADLALAERGSAPPRQARPRRRVRRRPGPADLQAEPSRRRRRRPRRRAGRARGRRRGARLHAARRRRAAVLLAGIRSPGRRPLPHAAGRVSRLSLVRRRPRRSSGRSTSPTRSRPTSRSSISSRPTRTKGTRPTSTSTRKESRNSGSAASTAPSAAARSPRARCSGC